METQETKRILRLKRSLARSRTFVTVPKDSAYVAPTCRVCGVNAVLFLEPDGACGDPECCPQTEHIAIACPNLECEALSVQAEYR